MFHLPTNFVKQLISVDSKLYIADPDNDIDRVICPDAVGEPICLDSDGAQVACDYLDDETNADGVSEADYLKTPLIVSCGWSDDRLGRRLIQQGIGSTPGLGNPSTVPFITKGSVNVQGSATLWNYYTNLNIWAGDSLTNIGDSGRTYVRDPNIPPPSETEPPPTPAQQTDCGDYKCYLEVTDKTTTGPDVIADDPTLKFLSDAQMLEVFLGVDSIETYKQSVATTLTVDQAEDTATWANWKRSQAVVVDPVSDEYTLPNTQIGTRDEPVVLVVNGDMSGGGSPVVYGAVYVTGNLDVAGNITVYGSMIVEGTVGGTGSLDIVYDPFTVENVDKKAGNPAPIPGDWRDWGDYIPRAPEEE